MQIIAQFAVFYTAKQVTLRFKITHFIVSKHLFYILVTRRTFRHKAIT